MRIRGSWAALAAAAALLALAGSTPVMAQKTAPKTKITAARAGQIALRKYHGKIVGKIPLENEDGKWQYAVTVRSGKKLREVMVDGNTAKITSVETVTPAEEAREAKAETGRARKHGTDAKKPAHPDKEDAD
jgi:2,3-bisphosphoglycerate-independent phosphoglycerate mutase